MPNKKNQLPAVVVLAGAAPCGHAREADAVVDDVINLPVCEVLRFRLAHVRRFRIEVLSDLRFSASVIAVAGGAMVGEVGARLPLVSCEAVSSISLPERTRILRK